MFNNALKDIGISLPGYPRYYLKSEIAEFPQGLMLPARVILKSGIIHDPCLIRFTNSDQSDDDCIEAILPSKQAMDLRTRFACRNLNDDDRNPWYKLFQDPLGCIYYLDYPAQFFLHDTILPTELEEIQGLKQNYTNRVYFPDERKNVSVITLRWNVEYIKYAFLPVAQRPQLNLEKIFEQMRRFSKRKGSGVKIILAPSLERVRDQIVKNELNVVPLVYDGHGSHFGPSGEAYGNIDTHKDITFVDLSAGQLKNTSHYVKVFMSFLKGCVLITGITPLERAYLYSYSFNVYDFY